MGEAAVEKYPATRPNFSPPISRIALVYQSFCSRTVEDRLQYDWIAEKKMVEKQGKADEPRPAAYLSQYKDLWYTKVCLNQINLFVYTVKCVRGV